LEDLPGFEDSRPGARDGAACCHSGFVVFLLYSAIVDSVVPADIVGVQVTEHGPHTRTVTVTGELDALTAPVVATVLTEALAVARVVVVNLDGVQYLASAGLRVLIEAKHLAAEEGSDLLLVCHSPSANRVLDGSGLREHFTFADSAPTAVGQPAAVGQ
jgi:anti-sigma B factor antagonist